MAAEEDQDIIPDSGALFTFGKSKFADNAPSTFLLKNDNPAYIACGDEHTALVTGNGKLYVFGSNEWGQLGLGSVNTINKPTCVKALKTEKVEFAACGRHHTLVSTDQGKVFSSGGNSEGQLGLGDLTQRTSFNEILFFDARYKIKQLSAGSNTSAALTVDGKLFIWGDNSEGQLGLGDESSMYIPHQVDIVKPVSWISCGYYHSAFVTKNGELYTFGEPENGKLGLPTEKLKNHKVPQRVSGISGKVQMVSCGGGHTVAVTDKDVYTFGLGQFGQLGQGTHIFEAQLPKVVHDLKTCKIRYVACGENHTAVITDRGLLYTFGDGRHGKLGLGEENFTNQFVPKLCYNFLKYQVQSVACGGCHMIVFATPRPKESKDELKKYLTVNSVNQNFEMSSSLQRTYSARFRRREKEISHEQNRPLSRTLPPLSKSKIKSTLPVTSNTIPPKLLKVRQQHSESLNTRKPYESAMDSMPSEERHTNDLVKSFSAANSSDSESQRQSYGEATDVLNMTHVMSMNPDDQRISFSPVQKRKQLNENEESDEESDEDEEEVKEIRKTPQTTVNKAPATEGVSRMTQVPAKSLNRTNLPEYNTLKTSFLERAKSSLFNRKSFQKPLRDPKESSDASKANDTDNHKETTTDKELVKNKDQQDEDANNDITEGIAQPNQEVTATGQNAQVRRRSPTCVLL